MARGVAPVEVANVNQRSGARMPTWNPVLFQPAGKPLTLFYKVGPNPREWWGMVQTSDDGGLTWSTARRLADGILGPIKNKPVQLSDGVIIAPSSTESKNLTLNEWRIYFELSPDAGSSWRAVRPAPAKGLELNAIQPTVLTHDDGRLQALARAREGHIVESWSSNEGHSWSAVMPTELPNPNSGLDAVTLRDHRFLLVYNHTSAGRSPLNVAISRDGRHWNAVAVLESEPGEYSYPSVIQAPDGRVHITYTWQRTRIKHVVLDEQHLDGPPIVNGVWPQP